MKRNKKVKLHVIRNILDVQTELFEGDDVQQLFFEAFGGSGLGKNVELYHENITIENKINLDTVDDVNRLLRLQGNIYAVVVPLGASSLKNGIGGQSWGQIGVSMGISLLISVASMYLAKKFMKSDVGTANSPPSPNNLLQNRSNAVRLGGRVPDIYGNVLTIPDHIIPPYSIWINGTEHEHSMFCVGRGLFFLPTVDDFYEGNTKAKNITGISLQFYNPPKAENGVSYQGNDPLSDTPALQVGNIITGDNDYFKKHAVKKFTECEGRILHVPDNTVKSEKFVARANYTIEAIGYDLVGQFKVGSTITITDSDKLGSGEGRTNADGTAKTYNLNGNYKVVRTVAGTNLNEDNVDAVTLQPINTVIQDWVELTNAEDFTTGEITIKYNQDEMFQGYFYTDYHAYQEIWVTFLAPNGLYQSSKKGDSFAPLNIRVQIDLDIVDNNDNVVGTTTRYAAIGGNTAYDSENSLRDFGHAEIPEAVVYLNLLKSHSGTFSNSKFVDIGKYSKNDNIRRTAGRTIRVIYKNGDFGTSLEPNQRLRIRMRRITPFIKRDGVEAVQELQIKEIIGANKLTADSFRDDITTIYSTQRASANALQLKERKLKVNLTRACCLAGYGNTLFNSREIVVSIAHILIDKYIGNLGGSVNPDDVKAGYGMLLSNVDVQQIIREMQVIQNYFGINDAAYFNHLFDDNNITAEEMVQTVCDAVFSIATRVDGKVSLKFDRPTLAPVAVFNSYNITPNSFTKTENFGAVKDQDGVEVTYKRLVDDKSITMRYPKSAINPEKVELTGVKNGYVAYLHLMRRYNKQVEGVSVVEFTGGDESCILSAHDRINVADLTNAEVFSGEVDRIEGNILYSKQALDVDIESYYFMNIQTIKGSETIFVTPLSSNSFELEQLPSAPVSIDPNSVVRAVFNLISTTYMETEKYIVIQKDYETQTTNRITALNYSDAFYTNDSDVKNNTIAEELLPYVK